MLRKTYVHSGPLHTVPDGCTFGLYSTEEIKKLSVVEILTPLSFNALGHPLRGGLYDPRMGPFDVGGQCDTCQQSVLHCPGHFGRIDLLLPVINPLFSKTLLQICRMTCLGCREINIPGVVRHLSIAQLRLLSKGFLKEAQDAEFIIADMGFSESESKKSFTHKRAVNVEARAKFAEYVEKVFAENRNLLEQSQPAPTKNIEAIKTSVIKRLLSYAKMGQKCWNCGLVCKKMMLFESKIVYTLVYPTRRRNMSAAEKGMLDMDEHNDLADPEIGEDNVVYADDEPDTHGVQKYLTPTEARDHLRGVWAVEQDFLKYLFPVLGTACTNFPTDLFFVETVSVPPPKNRAAKMVNNMMVENPQNLALRHIVTTNSMLYYVQLAKLKGPETLSQEATKALKGIIGKSLNEKLETLWKDLQADVDHVMDREKSKMSASSSSQMIGLKQIIEKKEGLFRMHMMGKRVNYAARTVITPDPIIHIEEVGIPDVFAKVLTFPTPVTPWNVQHLRKLVMNGPNVHPGAVAVENELGQISKLDPNNDVQRAGVANRLFASDRLNLEKELPFKGVKTVYRHLMNGDYLLLNRQPSLHRPSIMAHRARVLYGDKVFRLHYANCKHYNADFDGDEMNAHFPQSHVARSEAANLVNVCSHFLVPKDGTPLSGLIQDHVVAGVRLTMRGRFFSRADYHQLVNFALSGTTKVIVTEPPTIIKPCILWSGKQVISTVVKNLVPHGKVPLSFISGAKIKSDEWRQCPAEPWKAGGSIKGDELSESAVIIRHGELLSGVIDKVHLGATPYGLIHSFYELYGNQAAGALLSAFSRLMTNFLQWEGFTLGVKDVLVKPEADKLRRHYMEEAANVGPKAAAAGVSLKSDAPEELVAQKLEAVHRSRDNKQRAFVDLCYKQSLDQHVNQINKSCLPHGLVSIFPHNNLQLLVQSGAKGSTVNTMQMSCALGQIELEGKRPPLSISGKSLPSFKPYDVSPRAGGFIAGRFLTGIRPQEFFFHCMAGREGLIDTAVKTSRSGYLQRCLVKLLEGLVTQYDGTVRDSDGSVIQFIYGEDGLDVCKSQFLKGKQLDFLAENWKSIVDKEALKRVRHLRGSANESTINEMKAKFNDWVNANGHPSTKTRRGGFLAFSKSASSSNSEMPDELDSSTGRTVNTKMLMKEWQEMNPKKRKKFMKHAERCPEPIVSVLNPFSNFSVVSEKLEGLVSHEGKRFKDVVFYKAMSSLSSPGDAVGVLAAQSIGEPSTQMTLNTFHFAGRGEMNVTLGIPRLREILMVASANIKTPSMDIPFLPSVKEKEAENLRLLLTSVTIAQVLQHVEVSESIDVHLGSRIYNLKFVFLEGAEYAHKFCVKPSHVLTYFERKFVKSRLVPTLRKVSKQKKVVGIDIVKEGAAFGGKDDDDVDIFNLSRRQNEDDDDGEAVKKGNAYEEQEKKGMGEEHESSDEEPEADDADATQQTRRSRHTEAGYDEPEEEERLPEVETEYGRVDDADASSHNLKVDADEELDEYEDPEDGLERKVFKVSVFNYEARVNSVKCVDDMVMDYDFDRSKEEWCTLTVKIPLAVEKVNMSSILRSVAEKSIIHQVPNITRAFLVQTGDKMSLKTEGINILAMAAHRDLLDLNKLHCNNIHTMADSYGIEAASKVLVKEMTDVFKAYGIVIDQRHLTLIADFMTFSGTYRPFNRIGIESSASPLQQMSFETVVTFLRDATLTGKFDDLSSPSSRLVLGKPVAVGTGLFTLRQKLDLPVQSP